MKSSSPFSAKPRGYRKSERSRGKSGKRTERSEGALRSEPLKLSSWNGIKTNERRSNK